MSAPIQLVNVTKHFRSHLFRTKVAVDDLNLTVEAGEVTGLIGANGSGKSTTLKMILGFLRPTRGEITIRGLEASDRRARRFIGYLPENPRFQKFLTAQDVLKYHSKLLDLPTQESSKRAQYLLEIVRLKDARKEKVQGYSKGMIQRLAIAQSLLAEPEILIFDEPMSGLDPVGRIEVRKIISEIHVQMPKTTIFFSSHVLSDVEELCSSILLLRKGKLITHCRIDKILSTANMQFQLTAADLPPDLLERIREKTSRETPMGWVVSTEDIEELTALITEMKRRGARIVSLSTERPKLETKLFSDPTSEIAQWESAL